ncbi:hypothetical protein J1TS5_10040 [Paenibacillus macerans]|uniref:hypothetical protein n=1 Tax=Paenibacillus macerans TaxID=44252 RepID=UPI001AFFBBA5|nr:hypothetical protein [Paenibacillus macerans]GIP08834.1 hypothetical protein J1TS5_10040 [Paenibacillus macerans]
MKKYLLTLFMMMSVFLFPVLAFAEEGGGENPVEKIGGYMKWKWSVLDGLDWLFSPIMIVISLLLAATFVLLIWRIIVKIAKITSGKSSIKDKAFWVEIGVVILILFLLFSGALFKILGNIYEWTNKQDIGGDGKTTSQIDRSVDDVYVARTEIS